MPGPMSARDQSRTRLLAGGMVVGIGLVHRLVVFLLYRHDLAGLLALNPDTLTWQYPTLEALTDHLGASLLYLQQTPPLPVLILGLARQLFGWPEGTARFCLLFQALLAAGGAWLMFHILLDCGARALNAATWTAALLVSADVVILEYNSFGQTFYEHLSMVLLLVLVAALSALHRSGRPAHAAVMGGAVALLALTRAAFSYLFVPAAAILLIFPRTRTRRHLALFLAPVLLLQGGWAVKNLAVHSFLSPSTSTWQGSNLLHGLQQAGLGRKVREGIEAERDRYPDWFLETIARHGLDPFPPRWSFYERFPETIVAQDTRIQAALDGTNRPMNSAGQRLLSSLYLRACLRFAASHPALLAGKLARSYSLFWQPIRNYGIQYVDLLFVEPVIIEPFALHRSVAAWWRGDLPERAFVMTGRISADYKGGRPTSLPALAMLSLLIHGVNLVALHALVPLWLGLALLSRRSGNRRWNIPVPLFFALVLYAYAAFVFNLAEHGENMRFRLTVEPIVWIVSYLAISTLAAGWRRGGREGE